MLPNLTLAWLCGIMTFVITRIPENRGSAAVLASRALAVPYNLQQ
jgi:hypothetical protein